MTTSRRGFTVYLVGNDGTGKTTQAELLLGYLCRSGRKCRYVWLRFPHFFSAPILVLSRLFGVTRYETVDGHRQGRWEYYRAPWLAHALLWFQVVDAALYRAVKLEPARLRGETIVLDRFVFDIAVDIAAAARDPRLLRSIPARLLYQLVPRGCTVFYDAPSDQLRGRRPDLQHDQLLGLRSDLYRELATLLHLRTIDATLPTAEVHQRTAATMELSR